MAMFPENTATKSWFEVLASRFCFAGSSIPSVFSFFTRSLIVFKLLLFFFFLFYISSLTESVVRFSLKLVSRV
jgi:hypothetical protein